MVYVGGQSPVLLLFLLAIAPPDEVRPQYDFASYLRIAGAYSSAERAAAVREIREWPPAAIGMAVSDLRRRKVRAFSTSPADLPIDSVEAAVLMHAEAGLLALRASSTSEARLHLETAVVLFEWSRHAAQQARSRGEAERGGVEPMSGLLSGIRPEYDVQPRIDRSLFSLALAAGALAAGAPTTAGPFAADARRESPFDPDVQLVLGAVAEGLAEQDRMRGRKPAAVGWLDEAAKALSQSVLLDAGLVRDPETAAHPTPRGLEARLRLGRVALEQGWPVQARRCFEEVDRTGDDRQRYLARLLLGRLADRQGQVDDAIAWYRRALEAWPESQAAALALAHATERSSGPTAARPLVAEAVALSLRSGTSVDPWRSYLFGPPGLAEATLDRIRMKALGQ